MNTTKVYEAILAAADHIERSPLEFEFVSCVIPSAAGCGTPGCALGWIASFIGIREKDRLRFSRRDIGCLDAISRQYLKISAMEFYDYMAAAAPGWIESASKCAQGLRLFAETYMAANER